MSQVAAMVTKAMHVRANVPLEQAKPEHTQKCHHFQDLF